MTPLDHAHAAMQAAPDDPLPRLRFYEALAEGELVVLLKAEPLGEAPAEPQLFPTAEGTFVLAFDTEDRLTAFTGAPAPYAALPGRALVESLTGCGLGLGLNLGTEASQFLMPADAVDWLADVLASAPSESAEAPEKLRSPTLPETLLVALDRKLARAGGLASHALLVGADWPGGRRGHLLALIDAMPGAEPALAQAVGEALAFSGAEAEALDIAFLGEADPLTQRLTRLALRFDLPEPERTQALAPLPPGMDPDKPPNLR